MPKFALILLYSVAFLLSSSALSQDNAKEIESTDTVETEPLNTFENLIPVDKVVYQLRKNYGVSGSVLLTKTLWQILSSYSNQKQAQNVWQTAINNITSIDTGGNELTLSLDSRYTFGQILSQFTHGMNLVDWNTNRNELKVSKSQLNDFFTENDDLSIYLNLNHVWRILLLDIAKQENIQWDQVFLKSLDLFADEQMIIDKKNSNKDSVKKNEKAEKQEINSFFMYINQWQTSKDKNALLANMFESFRLDDSYGYYFHQTIIQFLIEKHKQHYLSASLSWFAISQQLYLYKTQFQKEDVENIKTFVENQDTWFLSHESDLLAANTKLPELVEKNFHGLKAFLVNKTEVNDFELELITIYHLLIPNFSKYIASPYRREIMQNLEVCFNISDEYAPFPQLPIEKEQFYGCINDMFDAANNRSTSQELAYPLVKVDTQAALDRALKLPPWQNINVTYATIAKDSCLSDNMRIPNPFEWSMAAESLLWFSDRWPAFMKLYPQGNNVNKVIAGGQQIVAKLNCLEETPKKILNEGFQQISQSWQNSKAMIDKVVDEFAQENLRKGSDIDLLGTIETQSNYRVEDMKIEACNIQNACGVHLELESSRALFGLFPKHLVVADQLKMGSLKLCYDNVGWEQRRPASTHLDNDNVSNYFGHFSFSLKGFYDDEKVFERKIIDKEEYLYLFAENSEDVLNTYCPLEIVGKKISTKLERGTFGLVPNRLTFLTASRVKESDIMSGNWLKGNEWNDKILTDAANSIYENKLTGLNSDVQQVYQAKAKLLQDVIYKTLLNKFDASSQVQTELYNEFATMQRSVKQLYATNYLLQMNQLMSNDKVHGLFFGEDRIFDAKIIEEYYTNQNNINVLIKAMDENLNKNKILWNELSNNLSYSYVSNIIYRLKSIY